MMCASGTVGNDCDGDSHKDAATRSHVRAAFPPALDPTVTPTATAGDDNPIHSTTPDNSTTTTTTSASAGSTLASEEAHECGLCGDYGR